uniref:Uncharacterized protein n=1 Tax=Rhizophora mucronata TaxID=61149 RepID=A0A2P2IH64_RHIMU
MYSRWRVSPVAKELDLNKGATWCNGIVLEAATSSVLVIFRLLQSS